MSKIIEISNTDEFLKLLSNKDKVVLLDFHATWCRPCKNLGEYLHDLVDKSENTKFNNIIFTKVDVDNNECDDLVKKFNVG